MCTGTSEIGSGGTPTVTYNLVGMPAGATYDPTTNLLTWTPGFTQSGDYAITFSAANDGDGTGTPTTATMTVHIHVNKEYASPVVTPVANQTVAAGATLDFSVQAVDPDGSPLTLMVDGLPGFATLTYTPDGKGTIHVAPVPGDRGNYTLTLNATPNIAGASAALTTSTTFILSVTSPNEPPVLMVVKNGLNIFSFTSAGMPVPLSRIRISTASRFSGGCANGAGCPCSSSRSAVRRRTRSRRSTPRAMAMRRWLPNWLIKTLWSG